MLKKTHPWLHHIKVKCVPSWNEYKELKKKGINPKKNTVNRVNYLLENGFHEKVIKSVLSKMNASKRPSEHYHKKTGMLKKQYKKKK